MKEALTVSREQLGNLRRLEPQEAYSQQLADKLSKVCIGQEEAMDTIARRMTLAESSMNDTDRPLGVMLFAGKTGTGKTQASHAASEVWFGDKNSDHLKIIDCTEYSEKHMKLRLTGAPPSYVGYNDEPVFTDKFLAQRNIIVLDEFEKAHPEFHKVWLQVFEDARMSTGKGDKLNFNNSLIILTSNAGAEEMQAVGSGNQKIGFGSADKDKGLGLEQVATKAIKERFKEMPELLGRIDDVVVFKDLQPEHYSQIFDNFLMDKNMSLYERLQDNAPFLAVTSEFKGYVLDNLDKTYGARDMRKNLDRELFHKVADMFMGEDLTGRPIVADREEGETVFYTDNLDSELLPERPELPVKEEPPVIEEPQEPEVATIIIFTGPALPEQIDDDTPEPPIRKNKRPHKKEKLPRLPRPRNEITELDYTIFQQ